MTPTVPTGTAIARPFLPVKDFELSKRFYEALGFTKVFEAEVAIYQIGQTGFILQKYYQKDWAENCMMHLMVDDLDAWWAFVSSLDLRQKFGVPEPKAPTLQPWACASPSSSIPPASSGISRSGRTSSVTSNGQKLMAR